MRRVVYDMTIWRTKHEKQTCLPPKSYIEVKLLLHFYSFWQYYNNNDNYKLLNIYSLLHNLWINHQCLSSTWVETNALYYCQKEFEIKTILLNKVSYSQFGVVCCAHLEQWALLFSIPAWILHNLITAFLLFIIVASISLFVNLWFTKVF